MQTKLSAISDIFARLASTEYFTSATNVYHYTAPDKTEAPYFIWAEDDRVDLTAGNIHAEKAWQGTIDLYTHTEFDVRIDYVESLLDANFIWRLESVQYEEDTGLIHYEWVWNYA
jgi:hypothetical protein